MQTHKVKIKLVKPPTASTDKISIIKVLMKCANGSLKWSKDLYEALYNYPNTWIEVEILPENIKLLNSINEHSGKFEIIHHEQYHRDLQLLKLGIGEKTDYIKQIKFAILNSLDKDGKLIDYTLDKLTIEQLKEIMTLIN